MTTLSHHELLVFWTQLLALYTVARLLGAAARRIGMPSVVGELLAGVILGPSLFGAVWKGGFDWFLPDEAHSSHQGAMLLAVSWYGAAFLLVVAGFETDLDLIRRLGRASLIVTAGSVIVPFVGGLAAGWLMPTYLYGELDGQSPSRIVFALFIAATVAVSALAVVAKILGELGLMRRDVGQITIAVGMANDLVGWVVLGIIAGLAASGELSAIDAATTVLALTLFMALALTLGQRGVDFALRAVRRDGRNVQGALTVVVGTMLFFGVITQLIGVEAVLGAFVAGVILARSRYQQIEAEHVVEDLTAVIFAPLFFATAGLRLDLSLLRGSALMWALILLAVALGLKFIGSFAGARLAGLTSREGLVLGAGLNARGALEIIIATVGLSLGVFNQTTFTIIVMIPMVTSLLASIGLRVFSRDLEGSVAERERLVREQALNNNLLVRSNRILLPATSASNAIVAAQIAHFAWPEELGATVLAASEVGENDIEAISNVLYPRKVDIVGLESSDVTATAEAIVGQARLGYGVIAFGVSDKGSGRFLSPLLAEVLKKSEVPVVLVRKAWNTPGRLPGVFAEALVPVVASSSSRAAQELAANLSAGLGTQLTLSHVIYQAPSAVGGIGLFSRLRDAGLTPDSDVAERVLTQSLDHAIEVGARADTAIRFASTPAVDIVLHAAEIDADLVVMGAQLRRLDDAQPSLGPNVEHVLANAPQTVVVVAMPDDRPTSTNGSGNTNGGH